MTLETHSSIKAKFRVDTTNLWPFCCPETKDHDIINTQIDKGGILL